MFYQHKIWIGNAQEEKVFLNPRMANRHGLIAGATGTGKTVTLKVLAESFSDAGVPVFLADVKGDLSGLSRPGLADEEQNRRVSDMGLADFGFSYRAYPAAFWDIYGQTGIPLRTTISEMGPVLLAKLMELNATQADILTVIFKIADDRQLLLIDTKDLKAMLQYVGENSKEFSQEYGNIAKQSVNAILRHLVALEAQGGEQFFAEPALNISDWFAPGPDGRGKIHILDGRELVNNGTLYSAFLLWMLSELLETLPEMGDPEKPRMVFFFDEAHLLFKDCSKALQGKIEQIVKLIRSKGVGIYFITQSPRDIPDSVLSQLGNKIQHALRAYTPADEKAMKTAAESFRANPAFSTLEALANLGTGEALVSVLDDDGIPGIVQKCRILPPQSLMGPLDGRERDGEVEKDNLYLRYARMEDRDSAYEFLQRKKQLEDEQAEAEKEAAAQAKQAEKEAAAQAKQAEKEAARRKKAVTSGLGRAASSAGGTVGREVGSSLGEQFGGKFGKKLGGNIGASLGRSFFGTFFKSK